MDESGRSRYVTEGGLRAVHRKPSPNPYFVQQTPYHSFARADALPPEPGEAAELTFQLWPTSVLLRKGHRLRIAIAGADSDMFDRVPAAGRPTVSVARNETATSFVDLPIVGDSSAR